jgi:uncharacterized Ntn-hydrolase superfamily protein
MTDQQLYFAIGLPVFTVILGMAMNVLAIIWQSNQLRQYVDVRFRAVEDRLDKIERTLEIIQTDLKEFYRDITRLKHKTGLE